MIGTILSENKLINNFSQEELQLIKDSLKKREPEKADKIYNNLLNIDTDPTSAYSIITTYFSVWEAHSWEAGRKILDKLVSIVPFNKEELLSELKKGTPATEINSFYILIFKVSEIAEARGSSLE